MHFARARLAGRIGEKEVQAKYLKAADDLRQTIEECYDPGFGPFIKTMIDPVKGKRGGIDISVVLAVIHGRSRTDEERDWFDVADPRMQRTVFEIQEAMRKEYPINLKRGRAVAIGRYPGDIYDGHSTSIASPWFLATAAMAEMHYLIARWYQTKDISVTDVSGPFWSQYASGETFTKGTSEHTAVLKGLCAHADEYLDIIREYAGDGTLSEQFHRVDGRRHGAVSLTWSHAAFLTALAARRSVASIMKST